MHLPEDALHLTLAILRQRLPGAFAAYLFGSRATGRRIKPFSDIDICLKGPHPLPASDMAVLRDAFEASDLPFRVDVVDWLTITPEFRAAIADSLVPLWPRSTEANTSRAPASSLSEDLLRSQIVEGLKDIPEGRVIDITEPGSLLESVKQQRSTT